MQEEYRKISIRNGIQVKRKWTKQRKTKLQKNRKLSDDYSQRKKWELIIRY